MTFPMPFFSPVTAAANAYSAQAVTFDGTNNYLTRGAGLTGAADSKMVTGCFFIRKQGTDGAAAERVLSAYGSVGGGSGSISFRISKSGSPITNIQIVGENASGTPILNIGTSTDTVQVADGWVACAFSVNMAVSTQRQLYLGDTSDLNVTTYTDDTIDFTLADWACGANADGTEKLQADLAEVRLWPGVYLDISNSANRRLLYDASGHPADPSVANAINGTPLVQFSGSTSAWHTNKGSGGGFTENGTLTGATTSP